MSQAIKEGMFVACSINGKDATRTLGIVTSANYEASKFMVMIIMPSSSGRPIEFSEAKLAPIVQMNADDAHRKDVKDAVIWAQINEIVRLKTMLIRYQEAKKQSTQ